MIVELAEEVAAKRRSDFEIDPIFLNRWSPRSMTGESLSDEELMPLFEAARWAPSSYNAQQRRFLYARRDTPHWDIFFDLLAEGNKVWCGNAAVLVVVIARKNFEFNEKLSRTNVYDTGAAWENLALEGCRRGLVVHGMQGFDYDKARTALSIPDNYDVCAMIAIGHRGRKENLPPELQEAEEPNDRRPLGEIVMEGMFQGT
jgi:nitroreductase